MLRSNGRFPTPVTAIAAMFLAIPVTGVAQPQQELGDLSQSANLSFLPHATGAVTIDGVLGDEIWAQALVVELDVETNPRENLPAAVRTTAY
ncbi:MAG TPA: hypothetical protein VJA26_00960, partial [Gammaproteobacteria bacterium]|nr:hypothetical protein [Gammaproteobacteria bacterium]